MSALELSRYVDPVLRYRAFPLHSRYQATLFQYRSISTLDDIDTYYVELGDLKNIGVAFPVHSRYQATVFQYRSI